MGIENYLHIRVMIVDDLQNMRDDLLRILKGIGFSNIKTFPDGKLAWEELKSEALYGKPYGMVFSDINMPFMNGLTLLKSMRGITEYKKIPIFMVSTETEKDTIVRAIVEGATDYLIKPYDEKLLIEKLHQRLK